MSLSTQHHGGGAMVVSLSTALWNPTTGSDCVNDRLANPSTGFDADLDHAGASGELRLLVDGDKVVQWRYAGPAASYPRVQEVAGVLESLVDPLAALQSHDDVRDGEPASPRRDFVTIMLAAALTLAVHPAAAQRPASARRLRRGRSVDLHVHGRDVHVAIGDAASAAESPVGSSRQCGSCMVRINGEPVLSCVTTSASADGRESFTINSVTANRNRRPRPAVRRVRRLAQATSRKSEVVSRKS